MAENSDINYTSTRVVKHEIFDDGVHLLSFKRNFGFIPGQVVALTLDFTIEPRLYSIASGTEDQHLKILFDIKPDGMLTNRLSKLLPGEPVYISNPIGTFTSDKGKAFWIAAGTGIAPYASMFYSGLSENKVLIHGARTNKSFYFHADFSQAMSERYIRCCSKESGDGIYNGRLTEYLKMLPELDASQIYYICGSAEMIVDTREILISKGVPFEKIMAEIYF